MISHFVEETVNCCLTPVVDINDSHDALKHKKKKVTKTRCIKWIIWKLKFFKKLLENILCSINYGKVHHFFIGWFNLLCYLCLEVLYTFPKKVLLPFLVICTWNLLSYSNYHNTSIFEIYKAYPIFFPR